MKGFLAALMVGLSTGMVYAQQNQAQTQRDFTPVRTVGSAQEGGGFAPRTNQTRLAALQSDSSAIDRDSSRHVVIDDGLDLGRGASNQRPDANQGSPSNRRNVSSSGVIYGPENDPRIRNAVQEQQRYGGQSSQRSVTSVRPDNRRGSQPNERSVSTPASFSIYDLQITPDLEYQLKNKGFLYAETNLKQAGSDQIRLFGDRQLTQDRSRESKIFSSRIDTYQGNVVIDIDDYALEQIANGSYTLDDFDQYQARGVVLRYVDRDNRKVDITRLSLGESNNNNSGGSRRDVDESRYVSSGLDRNRGRSGQDDGHFVLPESGRGQRDTRFTRTVSDRNLRDDRGEPYADSGVRRSYQQRMADIYREDTAVTRERVVDLRDNRRYDDIRYEDERSTERRSGSRDLIDEGQLELARSLRELKDMRADLVRDRELFEIQERRRLDLLDRNLDPRIAVTDTTRRRYGLADLEGLAEAPDRFASRQYPASAGTTSDYLNRYATIPPVSNTSDPEFASFARELENSETRINKKIAAMDHARKLFAAEQRVDNQFEREQRERDQSGFGRSGGLVTSFNDDGLVRNTLGGNMAAGRTNYPGNRVAANYGNPQAGNGLVDLSLRGGQGGRDGGFGGSNQRQQVSSGASDKLVRALWFIAFLSIGINVYLALLARSFYSRYNELADELRETFTATV